MWHKIKRILVWTNQVRPSWWWQPWANTICYFPFTDNVDDSTGNYSLTRTNLTKWTIGYIFTQSWGNIHLSTDVQESTKFVGIWFKASSDTNIYKNMWFLWCNKLWWIQYWLWHTDTSTRYKIQTYTWSWWTVQTSTPWDTLLGNWHYLAYSLVWTTLYICRDWTVSTVLTATPYDYGWDMALCNFWSGASCSIEVSDWIMEDAWWSSDAMTEYYNNTKSKYWRS